VPVAPRSELHHSRPARTRCRVLDATRSTGQRPRRVAACARGRVACCVTGPPMTDPWTTSERQALRTLVRNFAEREVVPHLDQWETAGEVPRDVHRKAAEAGLLGVAYPEAVGGGGGDGVDAAIVTEELIGAGGSSGLCAALFTHGIAIPHMIAFGDPYQIDT